MNFMNLGTPAGRLRQTWRPDPCKLANLLPTLDPLCTDYTQFHTQPGHRGAGDPFTDAGREGGV
jgi:hypothetical protein